MKPGPFGIAAAGVALWCGIIGLMGHTVRLGVVALLIGTAIIWAVEELIGPRGPESEE